jgi:hypothetical protein
VVRPAHQLVGPGRMAGSLSNTWGPFCFILICDDLNKKTWAFRHGDETATKLRRDSPCFGQTAAFHGSCWHSSRNVSKDGWLIVTEPCLKKDPHGHTFVFNKGRELVGHPITAAPCHASRPESQFLN